MDIGLEIRLLRERRSMTSKDLAEKISLSQSQMSRLEKGQRRIDAEMLKAISKALAVRPSYFFEGDKKELESFTTERVNLDIGKMINERRHKLHMTPEELGRKIDRTKSFVRAIEKGEIDGISDKMITKLAKALKMSPADFFTAQQATIERLRRQVKRLESAHTESTLGRLPVVSVEAGDGKPVGRAIPVMGSPATGYPQEFDGAGLPIAEISDFVFVPRVTDERAFGLYCFGDSMTQPASPSFREGDMLIFSPADEVRNRDFVFARVEMHEPLFRQVNFDPKAVIRFQPLNTGYPPILAHKEEIIAMHKLTHHIARWI